MNHPCDLWSGPWDAVVLSTEGILNFAEFVSLCNGPQLSQLKKIVSCMVDYNLYIIMTAGVWLHIYWLRRGHNLSLASELQCSTSQLLVCLALLGAAKCSNDRHRSGIRLSKRYLDCAQSQCNILPFSLTFSI